MKHLLLKQILATVAVTSSLAMTSMAATPHLLVIDLGSIKTLTGIDWLSRMEQGTPGGVKDYKVYVY